MVKLLGTGIEPVVLTDKEVAFIEKITNKEHVSEVSIGLVEDRRMTVQSGSLIGRDVWSKR